VPFDIYAIPADAGGIYIVVEVHGTRRPHKSLRVSPWSRRLLLTNGGGGFPGAWSAGGGRGLGDTLEAVLEHAAGSGLAVKRAEARATLERLGSQVSRSSKLGRTVRSLLDLTPTLG
jgi:hypothetical protein